MLQVFSYRSYSLFQAGTTLESKYKVYGEICVNFRPVFRHFFMERFSKPAEWFERRLAYTRSVATNSIGKIYLNLVTRKPVFGDLDQLRLKSACTATETSWSLEILDLESIGVVLSRKRKTKVLIRLRKCTG